MKLAVIGIGQDMRGDDAAGLEAVRLWERAHPKTSRRSNVIVELIQQPGPELLEALEGVDSAVLVDAVEPRSWPGAVRLLEIGDLEAATTSCASLHGWGIAEMLALGHALGNLPTELRMLCVGIEAEQLGVNAPLSRNVAQALPAASDAIQRAVQKLLSA